MSIRDGIAKSLRWLATKTEKKSANPRQDYIDALLSGDKDRIEQTRKCAEERAREVLAKSDAQGR